MARGSGQTRVSTWNRCSADLVSRGCRFRIRRRADRPWIYVLEYHQGKKVRQFSTGSFRVDDDGDVETVYRNCLASHEAGRWLTDKVVVDGVPLDWGRFTHLVAENIRQRIPRQASRSHAEGHLRAMARFAGDVSPDRLERWVAEVDPIAQPSPFRRRLETLGQIQASGLLDVRPVIERQKARRPVGSARKRQQQQTQRPRAIPTDAALQLWLDGLTGHLQWVFALIATYGLRPSEAWHAEGIDERGWLTIPGEGLTKTRRHYAPPVPQAWVARYCLRDNFSQYQNQLRQRWPIKWEERDGLQVPTNNSGVASYLLKIQQERPQPVGPPYPAQIQPLRAPSAEGAGDDWVRPYDLRHAFAIRCFTDPAVNMLPTDDHAAWMGHGVDVHERIYLRWLPADRQKQALQERHTRLAASGAQEPLEGPQAITAAQRDSTPPPGAPSGPSELPAEIQAKLAKLEQLERLLRG